VIGRHKDVDVRVDGKHSGYITYRRTSDGAFSTLIEKQYVNFSDDGESFYTGLETTQLSPYANTVYTSDVKLTGQTAGRMDLKITFGPIRDELPAKIVFGADASGNPSSRGYSEFNGKRLSVDGLSP